MRLLAVFTVVALAEMATFFWVESRIGLAWALGLAVATALIGSVLVRRAGVAVLGRIQSRFQQGQLPGRELSHGAAILVSGAFLISPGFITDLLGFALLLPTVRDMIHRAVSKRVASRVTTFTASTLKSSPTRPEHHGDDIIDVEGWD